MGGGTDGLFCMKLFHDFFCFTSQDNGLWIFWKSSIQSVVVVVVERIHFLKRVCGKLVNDSDPCADLKISRLQLVGEPLPGWIHRNKHPWLFKAKRPEIRSAYGWRSGQCRTSVRFRLVLCRSSFSDASE
jgi:hypothetical protein